MNFFPPGGGGGIFEFYLPVNVFSTLVLVVYCHRQYCSDCNVEFHSVEDQELHVGHATELKYGDTYFSMGWGHLEARLQSCFVQVL